jgi:mono/diheme cytochrome c family protein
VVTRGKCWKSAAICALACAAPILWSPASGQTPRTADASRGKQLYFRHGCYGCHGFNGETGARRLVGSPILENPATFIAYLRLRADYQPLLPSTSMPSFPASALSDADALDVYAYVRTFVLHAPDPRGIAAFQKILESAKGAYKPSDRPAKGSAMQPASVGDLR